MSEVWIWPVAQAGELLGRLAHAAALQPRVVELGVPDPEDDLESWFDAAGSWMGVEIIPIAAPVAEVQAMIEGSAPAVLRVASGLIPVLEVRRGRATVLTPDGARHRVPIKQLAEALASTALTPVRATVAREMEGLEGLNMGAKPKLRVAAALVAARTTDLQISGVYALRLAAEAPLRQHLRTARLGARFVAVVAAYLVSYMLGLAGWWAIGQGALGGRLDAGWLAAWALLLLSTVAVRTFGTWSMGHVAIDVGALIKKRLLLGALRSDLDVLRVEGVGQSVGRVFEGGAVERLTIDGGFLALFASLELIIALVVLGLSPGGLVEVGLLVAMLVVTALVVRRYFGRRGAWTARRLEITHALIEAMVGHPTRLAQQPVAQRHEREDHALLAYSTEATTMDRTMVALQALIPRGWLVLAMVGLVPVVVLGKVPASGLALALGGVLLAHSALVKLTGGAAQLVGAAIAWRALKPLLVAATHAPGAARPGMALAPSNAATPAVTVRGVMYRPPRRTHTVLTHCDLTIERGEHVLLEGASGSGKSTLAALIAGLRRPDGGLILAGGLDRASLGASGWRRRVASAPQFHENHLFSASLAFNLLLGRTWPPRPGDLADAAAVCEELGLGEVLGRMPAGLFEMVGETGWQLSHGERCRVFLARALLQNASLVVLDESLAALDPGTLQLAIACIECRADAALVIAHP